MHVKNPGRKAMSMSGCMMMPKRCKKKSVAWRYGELRCGEESVLFKHRFFGVEGPGALCYSR